MIFKYDFTCAEFFKNLAIKYHFWIDLIDWIIVSFFVADLVFKYLRVRIWPIFFKKYWLDILAVFPFFLFFRLFEELSKVLGEVKELPVQVQKVVHLGLELREARLAEETLKISKEAEEISQVTRTERFARFLGGAEKVPELAKPIAFYEDPKHKKELKHHLKDFEREGKKLFKGVERELVDDIRRSRRGRNKRKNIQRPLRSIKR